MKYREELNTTTNNRVYKNLQKRRDKLVFCYVCFKRSNTGDIYSGCGILFKPKRERKCWKHYRKTQYKK